MLDRFGAFARLTARAGSPEGPLRGFRFAVKDLYDVEGDVTGAGNPDWARTHPPASRTATAVSRLLDAGAHLVGRTHTDEMAFGLTGRNIHHGTPVNPAAPGRVPGGSSSGSASAVSGGLVDFALGTDTAGSARVPAAFCGILGMRPTHGRIPMDGVVPLAPIFDTVGWFAREASVLEDVGRVLLGTSGGPPEEDALPRPALARDLFEEARPEVAERLRATVDALWPGAALDEVSLCRDEGPAWVEAYRILQGADIWRMHGEWIKATRPVFAPDVQARLDWTSTISANQEAGARRVREAARDHLLGLLAVHPVICLPTAPDIALPLDFDAVAMDAIRGRLFFLACAAGLAGAPQVSIPAGTVDGCPVGFSLLGPPGSDERLLATARRLTG